MLGHDVRHTILDIKPSCHVAAVSYYIIAFIFFCYIRVISRKDINYLLIPEDHKASVTSNAGHGISAGAQLADTVKALCHKDFYLAFLVYLAELLDGCHIDISFRILADRSYSIGSKTSSRIEEFNFSRVNIVASDTTVVGSYPESSLGIHKQYHNVLDSLVYGKRPEPVAVVSVQAGVGSYPHVAVLGLGNGIYLNRLKSTLSVIESSGVFRAKVCSA